MTGTGHGTAAAVAAAGRLSLFFIPAQPEDDSCHRSREYQADDDRPGIVNDSLKHIITPFVSVWSLPGTS